MLKSLLPFALLLLSFSAKSQGVQLWSEDFNAAGLPAGWSVQTLATDGGWKTGTGTALSSSAFAIPNNGTNVIGTNDDGCNCDKSQDRLVSPSIDLTAQAGQQVWVLFDAFYFGAAYQGVTENFYLLASTDDGATWNTVTEIDGGPGWRSLGFNISDYAGQANVRLAWMYQDNGGWLYGAALDNIRVVEADNVVRASLTDGGVLRRIDTIPIVRAYGAFIAGKSMLVAGTFVNNGFPEVTSFKVNMTKGTNTTTYSFDNLTLGFGVRYDFEIPVTIAAGDNNYTLLITEVNGGTDDNIADNSTTASITGITPVEGRKVVIEEATGTWCGWCPRGTMMLAHMQANYPESFIGIAVHNGDPMKDNVYDAAVGAVIGGYPSGIVDRIIADVDPLTFEDNYVQRMAETPKVKINQNVDWNPTNRKVTVTSYVQFLEEMNENLRIAVAYVEDDVTGTTSTYGQTNYYAGGGNGPMGGYQNLPSTVPASQMVYNHVAREIVGGFNGAANSVPALNPAGSVVSYTSTFTVPATYDITQMRAVTMLIQQGTPQEVVNAEETPIPNTFVSAGEPAEEAIGIKMLPNPVVDAAVLKIKLQDAADVRVRIVDAFGRVAVERNYGQMPAGSTSLPFQVGSLPAGSYILTVDAGNHTAAKPFVITR